MRYTVKYPSQRVFAIEGTLVLRPSPTGSQIPLLCIDDAEAKRTTILDPRAIVTNDEGAVVFTGCTTDQLLADLARAEQQ